MLADHLSRAIMAAARRPRRTLALALTLVTLAVGITLHSFDMTTDTGELISAKTPWRVDETAVETRFPQLKDAIVVVIDGDTPELASDAATRLAATLGTDNTHFTLIRRPDGGPYLAREGLLFSSLPDVKAATQKLIDAQPLLGPLAADPSLRGIAGALDTAAKGAAANTADPAAVARLAGPLMAMSQAIDGRLAGQTTRFSWIRMFAGEANNTGNHGGANDGAANDGGGALSAPTRALILAQPRLQFGDLQPGEAAVSAIQAAAAQLRLDAAQGVSVRMTGAVPLADEEFGTIRDNIGTVGLLMLAAMLVCLWGATRSWRMVAAIMVTILAGLAITLAIGLLTVGRLNLISVAFVPLFVGLGVDFGIQVSVRFNDERHAGATPFAALGRVGRAIGEPLLMAATAIFLALAAFLPTDYVGIAELGIIAGVGMIVAFGLNVTLLPALLVLLKPAAPVGEVGWAGAAPVDRWLVRHRRAVVWSFAVAMLASIIGLHWVDFDFNPMHLRDPSAPAMRTLTDLTRDPDRTPDTIAVLTPDADAARAMATRLSHLPEVARATSIDSFVPEDQPAKLAVIEDAQLLLDPTINPFDLPPPVDDAAARVALGKAASSLEALALARPGAVGIAASRLASSFTRLAAAPVAQRAAVEAMLVMPLGVTLDNLRLALQAGPVTRATLPPEIRDDWVAKDGAALVQVTPALPADRVGQGADNATLQRFTAAVRGLAPHATGLPVATQEAARTVAGAFVRAGVLALLLVMALLWLVLRSLREVAFTLAPVVLSGFLTLGSCAIIGQPLNFANIIAFPLLFGVGVAFHIYFVMAWRAGTANLLQTSLARAVVFSALATGSAFGALAFSHHPGTASMGLILMISLVWTLVCALIFEPALLGPIEPHADGGLV